jgi:hypothetical protein
LTPTPAKQLARFISRYAPEVRAAARAALASLRRQLPGAVEFVYDNYNACVIGFGPSERPSEAIVSLVLYPRYLTLCFLFGAELDDPDRLLRGSGSQVRHVRLEGTSALERPEVKALIAHAVRAERIRFDGGRKRRLVIRAVSAKRRPRRPRAAARR